MDEATLAIVRDELKRRDDDYEAATGIKSSREIIAQDAEWEATYQRLKHAELALAESLRKPGGCARYIPRRRRFCASRAADGCDGRGLRGRVPEEDDERDELPRRAVSQRHGRHRDE